MNVAVPSTQLPKGWRRVAVKDMADSIQYGHTASAIQRQDGPRFLRITDIQDGRVDWSAVPSCDIPQDDVPKYRLAPGDLVFARTGATTGKSFLIGDCPEAVFASYLIRVRVSTDVDSRYLATFFQSPDYWQQIEGGKRGIGQPNVNGQVLGQVQFPLAPPEEQRRIVAEIEKQFTRLEAGVAALRRVQANLKRYRAAVLKAACEGSPSVPLSEVCEVVSGFAFKSSDFCDEGIPVVKIANVSYGSYLDDAPSFLPAKFWAEFRRFQIQSGDILLALTRPVTNNQVKTCLYPTDLPSALLNQRVAKLVPTKRILRGYLLAYLRSEHFKSAISAVMPQTLQPNLSPRDLAAMPIPLPPLAEQTRIVAEVERRLSVVEELESVVSANLQRATRLRQSILQKAFTGELNT